MSYKIKKLVDEGFDFNSIYPEKQEEARSASSLNFELSDVVEFLRKQTNDFRDDFPLAQDLDESIYKLYLKYTAKDKDTDSKDDSMPKGEAGSDSEPQKEKKVLTKEELIKKVKGYTLLLKRKDDERIRKKAKAYITLLKIKHKYVYKN